MPTYGIKEWHYEDRLTLRAVRETLLEGVRPGHCYFLQLVDYHRFRLRLIDQREAMRLPHQAPTLSYFRDLSDA